MRWWVVIAVLGSVATAGDVTAPAVTYRGAASAITEPRYVRVTSQADFEKLWKEHRGEAAQHTDMLDVDFKTCMVIAIFQGRSANTDGVKLEGVSERNGGLLVRFDEWSYQTMTIQGDPESGIIRTTAYGFIVLPRSEKPVVLEENTQGLIGKPPIWTERARFPALPEQGKSGAAPREGRSGAGPA